LGRGVYNPIVISPLFALRKGTPPESSSGQAFIRESFTIQQVSMTASFLLSPACRRQASPLSSLLSSHSSKN